MDFGFDAATKYVVPVYILLIIVEYLRAKDNYNLKESASSFVIAGVSAVIASFTMVWAFLVFVFVFNISKEIRVEILGYESFGWAWYVWVICLLCDDFNFYWHHRWSHVVRLLWAAHIPHHNADTFNLTVSIRNGWFITLYKPIFWLWLPLIGFEPAMISACLIINASYQFFLHTQLVPSLGFVGRILNNPYVHVVHHSSNVEYMDKNHGGMLIIWDRIFGTYQEPIEGLVPKYGVTKGPENLNPILANTHEFQNIWQDLKKSSKFKDRFMYIFGPPGWSHDKSSKTAKQLQAELKSELEQQLKQTA
jgi:sterol desaturase/sphingolipid hydroxylase (fatty acid hydroxylase superfamily)